MFSFRKTSTDSLDLIEKQQLLSYVDQEYPQKMADTITPDAVDTGSITLDDLNINDTVPSTAANPEVCSLVKRESSALIVI